MSLETLHRAFPWPAVCPHVPDDLSGWLQTETAALLLETFPDLDEYPAGAPPVIALEIGAFKGLTTNLLANYAHHVIAVDTWKGSPEHQGIDMDAVFETFKRNLWYRREDVTFIRASSIVGMATVQHHGIMPHVVYLDADHSYREIKYDLMTALRLFPGAYIVGDDWNWKGEDPAHPYPVQKAMAECVQALNFRRDWKHNTSAFQFSPEKA